MQASSKALAWLGASFTNILFLMTGLVTADTISLQESIRTGVPLHPTVLSAKGELKTAKGSVWQSLSPPSPVVRIQNEWVPKGSNISDYKERTIGISQTLEFPLVTYFGVKSAHYSRQSAYSAYQVAMAQATAEIKMAYLDAWLAQQKVSIAESLHQAIESLAKSAELKYEVGEGTSIERDRLKAQAEQFNRNFQKAVLDFALDKLRLGQLIGRGQDTSFQVLYPGLTDTSVSNRFQKASSTSIIQEAVSSLKAARAQQNIARLSWLPQIELELFRQRDQLGGRFWGGAIGLSVPLWFTLGGTGNLKSAAGSVEKAEAGLEGVKRKWNLEWVEAAESFELAKSRIRSLEQIGLPSSRGAYDASIRAFEIGELGVTDLLASFLEKQASELDYLEAQRELWWWRTRIDILIANQN
jgi:outer membrane protein TolC